jgi:hypothetical protein
MGMQAALILLIQTVTVGVDREVACGSWPTKLREVGVSLPKEVLIVVMVGVEVEVELLFNARIWNLKAI